MRLKYLPVCRETLKAELLEYYNFLSIEKDVSRWTQTSHGGDLWLDVFERLQLCTPSMVKNHISELCEHLWSQALETKIHSDSEDVLFNLLFAKLSEYLRTHSSIETCDQKDAALLVCVIFVKKYLNNLCMANEYSEKIPVSNDSLLLLLSETYRNIRVTGFNRGFSYIFDPHRYHNKQFRPEYGCFPLSKIHMVDARIRVIPFFVMNHELTHLVNYADAYFKAFSSKDMWLLYILSAEQTACAVDLVLARDLSQWSFDLIALDELKSVKTNPVGNHAVLASASDSPSLSREMQVDYRTRSETILDARVGLKDIPAWEPSLPWLSDEAMIKHVDGTILRADLVFHPKFRQVVDDFSFQSEDIDNCVDTYNQPLSEKFYKNIANIVASDAASDTPSDTPSEKRRIHQQQFLKKRQLMFRELEREIFLTSYPDEMGVSNLISDNIYFDYFTALDLVTSKENQSLENTAQVSRGDRIKHEYLRHSKILDQFVNTDRFDIASPGARDFFKEIRSRSPLSVLKKLNLDIFSSKRCVDFANEIHKNPDKKSFSNGKAVFENLRGSLNNVVNSDIFLQEIQSAIGDTLGKQRKFSIVDATIIKYSQPGDGCPFHFDRPDKFEFNFLTCLEFDRNGSSSKLEIIDNSELNSYELEVGDSILFDSGYLAHRRTPVHVGERRIILSVGLNLVS